MPKKICCVILDYCGGSRTDRLYEKISESNPTYQVYVLDNASPHGKSKYVTNTNAQNSGIGGGIIDCLSLARSSGAKYLFFLANDIELLTEIDLHHVAAVLRSHPNVIQLGASLTINSDQSRHYPWMVSTGEYTNRIVPHSDILCCAINIEFIDSFGGFPQSRGGRGYDWEIAYQANLGGAQIIIADYFIIRHANEYTKIASFDHESETRYVENILHFYGRLPTLSAISNLTLRHPFA